MSARVEPSPEIWHRDDFPILCNWRRLWRAVEVGVDRAEFACMFLSRWQGHQYIGIDDYRAYPEFGDRWADRIVAATRLAAFGERARLWCWDSLSAAERIETETVGFVYLDGCHDYDSVQADLWAWWPKLAPGGILAGHDWTDQPAHAGVIPAVSKFARDVDRTVYLTAVEGYGQEICPSWYLYRDGLPGPDWRRC